MKHTYIEMSFGKEVIMTSYKVVWEVSKEAIVNADSQEEAVEKVLSGDVDGQEAEITAPPEAFEVV
jgi:hypothetical protein